MFLGDMYVFAWEPGIMCYLYEDGSMTIDDWTNQQSFNVPANTFPDEIEYDDALAELIRTVLEQ